jgi:hypothetical protein
MKFCFFKRLASALEETMSVALEETMSGATAFGETESLLIGASRKQSEEVSSSGGSSLEFWDSSAFFIGHEVLFYETTFSASALEH